MPKKYVATVNNDEFVLYSNCLMSLCTIKIKQSKVK